jgi:hypothetical protein
MTAATRKQGQQQAACHNTGQLEAVQGGSLLLLLLLLLLHAHQDLPHEGQKGILQRTYARAWQVFSHIQGSLFCPSTAACQSMSFLTSQVKVSGAAPCQHLARCNHLL